VEIVVLLAAVVATAAALWFGRPLLAALPDRPTVVVVAVVSAAVALVAPPEPTGWVVLDAVVRAGLGGGLALAAASTRLGWTAWFTWLTALALVVADAPTAAALAAPAGAGIVIGLLAVGERQPVLAAAAAGLAVQTVLRLEWDLVTGASLGLGLVAATPLLLAGAGHLPRRARMPAVLATVLAVVLAGVGAVTGGLVALEARDDVDRAVDAARLGLSALGDDDREKARAELAEAAAAFEEADDTLRTPWARLAFATPVVAQHARAVATMASSGAHLASTALDTLDDADPDTVVPRDGRVDLDAVEALTVPLDQALGALEDAAADLGAVDSPWLVTPVAERYHELTTRVVDARDQARTASAAAHAAPGLLGGDGLRRYLLLVQQPSESRGGGGFIGSWGELAADDGRLELTRIGRITELTEAVADPDGRTLDGERLADFVRAYGRFHPERYWENANLTPDFPTTAEVVRQLYPQSGGGELDGVVSVDPYGLAAFLDVTGPVRVPGGAELRADTAADYLLHGQYLEFADDELRGAAAAEVDAAREAFLGEVMGGVFEQLTRGDVPGPAAMAASLGPAVRGRHLQLVSFHDDEQRFFERIGATGRFAAPRGDSVGFVGQNYNGNKIDWFLHREASYDVRWDPESGVVEATLRITVRNDAPAAGLPQSVIGWGGDTVLNQVPVADGENLMLLTVYSALEIAGFAVDGQDVGGIRGEELGRATAAFYVRVPPQGASEVEVQLAGRVPEGGTYRLDPLWQPMVHADRLQVRVHVPDGWRIADAGGLTLGDDDAVASAEWVLDQRQAASIEARRRLPGWLDRLRGS
jgi:hypothetical protein